jgi:hypothetical protein
MRLRIMVSVLIALAGCAALAAVGRAQSTIPLPVTHHSVPMTLPITIDGSGQPVTVTLLLDIETAPGQGANEPTVKIQIAPKRIFATAGVSLGVLTVGDIQSVDFYVTPTAVAPVALLPTPTPILTGTGVTTAGGTITTTTVLTTAGGPVANDNANLRSGPGTSFAIQGQAAAGAVVELAGRNQAGDWYQLKNGLWIAAFLVDGAPADLPVIDGETPASAATTPAPPVEATVQAAASPTAAAGPAATATPEPTAKPPSLLIPSPTPESTVVATN